MKFRVVFATAALSMLPAMLLAGVSEVNLKLPLKPRIAMTGDESIGIAPFIIVTTDADPRNDRSAKVDVQSEFSRYLKKLMTKSTKMKVVDLGPTRLPSSDLKAVQANRDFWKDVGRRSGADYILSGSIDFDVQEKAGYRTEEYVSPVDGRTYYRQVLIETTGFVFDIVIDIYDGETGEKVIGENFRDFKEFDQRNYDEILGLFENLRALESQLLGIFVSQETSATRYVFTD